MESNESNREKRTKTDSSFHSFPDDLLVEILYKLPLELVVRLRSVSKHWNSLISDPCFAFNYCSRRPPPRLTCIRQTMFVEGSVYHNQDPPGYNILHNIHNFDYFSVLPFPKILQDNRKNSNSYKVIGSSNGLLLCASESAGFRNTLQRDYYICNPIPREWIKLPSPIMGFQSHNAAQVGFTTRLQGFLVVNSYKIVILHRIQTDLKFEVFSSETNTWQVYTMNPPCPLQVVMYGSVSRWDKRYAYNCVETTDGLLHWVDNSSYNVLISYNPYSDTNSCRLINLPKNQLQDTESEILYKRVDAFNGTLRYLEVFTLPGKTGTCIGIWRVDNSDAGNWIMDRTLSQDRDRFDYKGEYQILGPCHDSGSMYVWLNHGILLIYRKKIASSNEIMDIRYVRKPFYKMEDDEEEEDEDKSWEDEDDEEGEDEDEDEEEGELDYIMSRSWADILPLSKPIWPTTLKITSSTTDGHPCPIRIQSDSRKDSKSDQKRLRLRFLRHPDPSPPLSLPPSQPYPDPWPVKMKFKIKMTKST